MLPLISLLPTIIATITNAALAVGPMIAKYSSLVVEISGKYLPQVIKTVEAISSCLNILSPNESAEELGAKAMNADKKPENFDKFNDYINYLREEVKINKNELSTDKVDVISRQSIGVSLLVEGISKNLGVELTLPFIKSVSQLGINEKVIVETVKAYSENGLKLDDYEKYVSKDLSIESLDKHSDALVEAYLKSDSTMSIVQAENEVMDLSLPNNNL